jgi:radical SAM superfamily enzyme YgiQ (UPF0313 family)
MNILLFNPPTPNKKKFIREGRCTQEQGAWGTLWPPVSLAMIGSILEGDGHDVRIIDCPAQGVRWEDLGPLVRAYLPRIVIWSTATPSIQSDLDMASLIKSRNRDIHTAVFGTHVTVLAKPCLESFPDLDFVIRNEPELTARELVKVLQADGALRDVLGLSFRDEAARIIHNPDRPFIEDLDSLPFPAWHLLNLDRYRLPLKGKRYLIVSPLRGCPFLCTFCTSQTYYGKKLRKRTVESVLKEIEHTIENFGIRDFLFWAETFVVDKDYVRNLCQAIIARGLRITWTANSRVDTVDAQLLQLMAQAGCWMISYGIESGKQGVLDMACKGTKIDQAPEAVRYAKEAGIKTAGHFILGLPGDTEESINSTIGYAKQLGLDFAQFYCAVPFPGSSLYDQAMAQEWIPCLDFSLFHQGYAVIDLPTVSPDVVNKLRRAAYGNFYLNWSRCCSMLKLVNVNGIPGILRLLKDFRGWMQTRNC